MSVEDFRNHARQCFGYLITDFDFHEERVRKYDSTNQCQVCYESDTTRISIEGINYGMNADLRISSVDPTRMKYSTYCFDDLLELRSVDIWTPKRRKDFNQYEQVELYGEALQDSASDILRGDHSIFPDLAACIDRRARLFSQI